MLRGYLRRLQRKAKPKTKNSIYLKHKEQARAVIISSVEHWAKFCEVEPKRVAIRDQKSRWGSCSAHGNLNFSYKLLFLPACLRDYIVVHELCHLKELNHGSRFWQLVETQIPDYKDRVIELRKLEVVTRMLPTQIPKYTIEHTCSYCKSVPSVVSSAVTHSAIMSPSYEKSILV